MDLESVSRNIYSCRNEFDFNPPPEAPVFEPTAEDFSDPLGYINKIRPIAEKSGICKIRPPAGWQPPFSLDVDKLTFTPRIQKLNELEAVTRVKLHFMDQMKTFWELQGHPLKIPSFEGKKIDLFSLYHIVKLEGGFEKCTANKRWRKVLSSLGYNHGPHSLDFIKNSYERLLKPYYEFCTEKIPMMKAETCPKESPTRPGTGRYSMTSNVEDTKRKIDAIEIDADSYEPKPKLLKSKTGSDIKPAFDEKCSRELRKLLCYGAGPKMPGCNVIPSINDEDSTSKLRTRTKFEIDPLAVYYCVICRNDNRDNELLACNGCSETYHTFCLKPPLDHVPEGDWRCLKCIAEEIKKPAEAFGFAQAEREYTLHQFGEMADRFKSEYFNMLGHLVPTGTVEREFWRIVSSTDEDVTVEYGADLHSMDHGSGFPTKSSTNLFPVDQEYVDSGWNLNNLPVLEGSVLRFINKDISGMTVPWMYVGMCFSAFCWHNEDHWSYSINYLHWGDFKTWYGVPGTGAELLERTMKAATPELFQSQPDLLHQLVTIMNPNILMDAGVPIFRTDQKAGEFVITFPRAYHTGFNQGYNFAEAVNFAPADWLPVGRSCILHYKNLKRFCVFSHDELICNMAAAGETMGLSVVVPTYAELVVTVENEIKQRGSLATVKGVTRASRHSFDSDPDDERVCDKCKTTCFMSALICDDCPKMVCLDHAADLCQCSPDKLTLLYSHNLDELQSMVQKLKHRLMSSDKWVTEVKKVLMPTATLFGRADKIKHLVEEAKNLKIPKCTILDKLSNELNKVSKSSSSEVIIIDLDDED